MCVIVGAGEKEDEPFATILYIMYTLSSVYNKTTFSHARNHACSVQGATETLPLIAYDQT